MNAFKILGMSMVAVGGGAICYFLCKKEDAALCRATAWGTLVSFIGSQVECFALPIGQVLSRADATLLRDCGYIGKKAPTDLKYRIKNSVIEDRTLRAAAEGFCSGFGRGYIDEQTARCKYYAGIFEERKRKLGAELPTKKKLYATLCISASLAVIILFL